MTKRAGRISIVLAILAALGGAVAIVARAPKTSVEAPGAAFGH